MPIKFVSSIRDPVYGTIAITECEQEVLSLPIINRLNGIKQLGLAYLAFPGANHTRFEHSLGTMHVAFLMCQGLGIDDHITQKIRLAGLLHDVGHPPFSHTIELAFKMFKDNFKSVPEKKFSHEYWTKKKITEDTDLKKVMRKYLRIAYPTCIAKLAVGKYGDPTIDSILNSPIDADKTDYILRDNLHCGFPVALDINTITEILNAHPEYGCLIKSEGISFIEQLLIGRYHLITKIHQNGINRLGNYLLALNFKDALLTLKEEDQLEAIENVFYMNDYDLYSFLKDRLKGKFKQLKNFLMGNSNLKEIFNFNYSSLSPMARFDASKISSRKHLLPSLSKTIGEKVNSDKIYIDINEAKLPDLDLWVCDKTGQIIPINQIPLIQGIAKTSLSWLEIAVYSFENENFDCNIEKVMESYKRLDERIEKNYSKNLSQFLSKNEYGLLMLTELSMNRITQSLSRKEITSEDLLVVIFRAIYCLLEDQFKQSHLFIDGITNFIKLVKYVQDNDSIFTPLKEKGIEFKKYDLEDGRLPSNIFMDVEKLVNFGMLYRKEEVVKVRRYFNNKHQIRLSGWGRNYFEKNFQGVNEVIQLYERVYKHLEDYIKEDFDLIKEYIETSELQKNNTIRKKREKIREKTVFRITR